MNGKSDALQVALPPIPAKRYFTIGEVSDLCGVKPHVLRYWEQEFTQLRPMKRRGNRRYYQHHEVLLVRRIRELLYEEGFTINGARNRLSEFGGVRARSGTVAAEGSEPQSAADGVANVHELLVDRETPGPEAGRGHVASPRSNSSDLARRSTNEQQSLPLPFGSGNAQQSVREALEQALDLLR